MLKRLKKNRKQQREQQQQRERSSRFLEAARFGDLEKLLELIRSNIDVNTKNENDLYALHLAAKEGHVEVVKELLRRGAVVDAVTKKGNSALHLACLAGRLEAVKILVENGAIINLQSQNGFTPLYMAAQENHEPVVKLLLSCGADATIRNEDGFFPLDVAIQQGHGKLVASLLEYDPSNTVALPALHVAAKKNDAKTASFLLENGFAVDTPSKSGFSALHIAARYGNYEVCKALIDNGADVNWKAKNDITPLHVSSREGHSSVVELLINSGAQSDSQTAEGLTALHCAAVNGHDQVLDSLVRSGASLSLKTKTGLTPLHMALQGNQASCTRQLLLYNAPIDDTTEDDLTPLHVAAHCGNLRSAQILLDSGCDVNTKAKNGFAPLHIACMKNHPEMVGLLLQHDANIEAATESGLCPLHVAAFLGHPEVATSLLRHGGRVDAATKNGMTALYLATLANKTEMVKLLLQSGATVDAETVDRRTALHAGSELGNTEDVKLLLEHGASPGIKTADGFSPLDFATRAGNRDIVQLLAEHGAIRGEEFQKHPPSSYSSLAEFSMIRDEMRYTRGVEVDIKTPKLKRKSLDECGFVLAARSKPCGRDSRLSHVVSSLSVSESPSTSFWSSFLTDARGGEKIGCRHSGVRIILPPSKVPRPMGITCKLIRKEKLPCLPPVKEGEALACRALETSPAGSKFLGPVIFEVPHFASLRGQEREIAILRSDNGRSWSEHTLPPFDDIEPTLQEALLKEMMRQNSSLVHIITVDLPRFFAIISRIRMEQKELSDDGGSMVSTLFPKVKISFPEDSCLRETKVGLQAQPIHPELVSKFLGDQAVVSPIVTIEPRRRKFHHPISVTIPMPEDGQVSKKNLKLLCSISKGSDPALWEDITDLAPLASAKELMSFTTSVSGKYWFLDSPDLNAKTLDDVQKLYSMAVAVPFLSKFVVFAKRLSLEEGQLRLFCMTDDRVDKTLERQEQFVEVARSDDVEVLEGTAQYISLQGNLLPIGDLKDDQLRLNFHAFRENRLPIAVRVMDPSQEARGIVTFLRLPGVHDYWSKICTMEVVLPKFGDDNLTTKWKAPPVTTVHSEQEQSSEEPQIQKAELRLKDIAELIGDDWRLVASRLGITPEEVEEMVGSDGAIPNAEALAMLQQWVQKNGSEANGNSLERALRDLGRDDIIASCMCNVADVTDSKEKAAARSYLDSGVDPLKVEIGSVQDLGSSCASFVQHSLSPDSAYGEENSSKMAYILPDAHDDYDQENKNVEDMFRESRVGERFPFMDRSISTVSTNTLTTLPSDGGTRYQSIDEISSDDQTVLKAEMEEEEEERMLEDGTCIRRKVVTVRHLKHRLGSEDTLVGVEVEEDMLELAPGVELPLGEDVDVERHVENFVENLSSGVWTTRKVTTTKARKILSEKDTGGVPGEDSEHLVPLESKAEPTSRLDFVDGGDFLQKKYEENLPVEVEEELFEAKTRPVFCSRPRPASGWKVSSEDQIKEETFDEGFEGESEDKRGDGLSSRYSDIYEVPEIEPNICRVSLENGEGIQKRLSGKDKDAGTHLMEFNTEHNQDQQGLYPAIECVDVNKPTKDGVSIGGEEPQELDMKDAFDISLRQYTEEKGDAVLSKPFCNTEDENDLAKMLHERATAVLSAKKTLTDEIPYESAAAVLSAKQIVTGEMPYASAAAGSSEKQTVTGEMPYESAAAVLSAKQTVTGEMPYESAAAVLSAKQTVTDEMPYGNAAAVLSAKQTVTGEMPYESAASVLSAKQTVTGEMPYESAAAVLSAKQTVTGEMPYESAAAVLSAMETSKRDSHRESAEIILSTTDQRVADEAELKSVKTLSTDRQGNMSSGTDPTDVATFAIQDLSGNQEEGPSVPNTDTGYLWTEVIRAESSKEALSGNLEEQRPSDVDVSAGYLGAEMTKTEPSSEVISRQLDKQRSFVAEAGTPCLGAEVMRAETARGVFGRSPDDTLLVTETGTGYLGADVTGTDVRKEVLSRYLEEYRPCVSEADTECLEAEMARTGESKEVFSRYPDEYRVFVPEVGSEYAGGEVTKTMPSKEVFSGDEEYRRHILETGSEYTSADLTKTGVSKEVFIGYPTEYTPYSSTGVSEYQINQAAWTESSEDVSHKELDENRPCISEAEYVGAGVTRSEPSQGVSSGNPEEDCRPCVAELGSGLLAAEVIRTGTSQDVYTGHPEQNIPRVRESGSGYVESNVTQTDVPKEVLGGHLEEYRPCISEGGNERLEAEMEVTGESKAFSSYPDEYRAYIPEAGSEYQEVEKAIVDESKEVFSEHPQDYRPCVPEVGSQYQELDKVILSYVGSEYLEGISARRELSKDAFPKYLEEHRPCISEACTEYPGAEMTRTDPSDDIFSGYPGEGRPCSMDAGTEYLGTEVTRTEMSGEVYTGHLEQYRPCVTEDGTGYLEAEGTGTEMAVDRNDVSTYPYSIIGREQVADPMQMSTEYLEGGREIESGLVELSVSTAQTYPETGMGASAEPAAVFGGSSEAGGQMTVAASQLTLVPEGVNRYFGIEATGTNDLEVQTFKANDSEAQAFKANDSDGRTSATQHLGSTILSADFSPSEKAVRTDISSLLDTNQCNTIMEMRRTGEPASQVFAASAAPQVFTTEGQNLGMGERFIPQLLECKTFKEKEESTSDGKVPYEKLTRVILRRCVHKKTVITGCQEETMVTEDTHVQQDNDTPRELNNAIRLIIEQFVQGESNFDAMNSAA